VKALKVSIKRRACSPIGVESSDSKTYRADPRGESPRIDREREICPAYDSTGISKQLEPSRSQMGVRILDDFCEEHMM
jgi:hypothetical protein